MEHYIEKLKSKGFKLTPRRHAIIKLFFECCGHMTPEDVFEKLKKNFTKCGVPGVYRNLESLAECGVLTRIQQFDRKRHYGLCHCGHDEHHHHITCIKCGKVDEIKDCVFDGVKKMNGYKVVNHFIQINGICSSCLKNKIHTVK